MFIRYVSAITTGTVVTFALLFTMQLLISMQPSAAADDRVRHTLNWASVREEQKPPPPPKPIERRKLTDVDRPPIRQRPSSSGPTLSVYIPGDPGDPTLPPIDTPENLDGPLVAMIRVEPSYPTSATARELEGYTIVEFDVLTNGKTANVRVIESSNRIFDKPSIRAAQRFKYKPRVVNGQPQISTGIQSLFRFEMDKD